MLRAPQPADAEAVMDVLAARELADIGERDFTLEDLRDEWRIIDPAANARVAELDGRIVGYAVVREVGALAAVHPQFEGRCAGSALVRFTQQRERELGHEFHRQWVAASNRSAGALLRAHGYSLARSFYRMVRELDEVEAVGGLSALRLRAVDLESDARSLHALDTASFAGTPGYVSMTYETFAAEHLQAHDFDPELSRIAIADDEPVGFLLARHWREERCGYVAVLGVHPEHHGRGIGGALLLDAFAGFAAAGLASAQLSVASDNPQGLRLYERAGMRRRHRFDIYERKIRLADSSRP